MLLIFTQNRITIKFLFGMTMYTVKICIKQSVTTTYGVHGQQNAIETLYRIINLLVKWAIGRLLQLS